MTVQAVGPMATHAPHTMRTRPLVASLTRPLPISELAERMDSPITTPIAPGTRARTEWARVQCHEPFPSTL